MPFKVAIVGTGIFATDAHLPALLKSEYFTPYSCFNRTRAKAEKFAKVAGISKIYNSMEEAFEDPEVDIVDALLPVQYNLAAVRLAVKHKKSLCFEKPVAANMKQAKEIVRLTKENPNLIIAIGENWSYLKAVPAMKEAISKIGKIYSFTYQSTGQFHFDGKYLNTSWRLHPEHIGGYLSDGGVHQLALLTGVLGKVKKVNAHTKQVRQLSGDDDILYSLLEMDSGLIGTFTYGSAFGNAEKRGMFEVMGDNGSVSFDFGPGHLEHLTLRVGGSTSHSESYTKEIDIEGEDRTPLSEFTALGKALTTGDKSTIVATPEVVYHHLAVIDAALKSSAKDGESVLVMQ
ncbi:hypothetical protein FOA43_002711 [Brettanomyces nanus]|uniref:Oxidoreductase n=1 Tax=Eeniella nana TaxID=13502 RepID=A0A875S328_EENNA|nr:uncharacterized protein FOA43_002711 [Brettanomyces nanus]QPG75358.1 hypothetical protein FOA43_002711 [Brettanomyces nanus]